MLKKGIRDVFNHFNSHNRKRDKSIINRIVWKLPQSKDTFDRTSLSVWGILSGTSPNKEGLSRKQKMLAMRFATTNFTSEELIQKLRDTKADVRNIVKGVFEEMNNEAILFEHFLVDFLSRNKKENNTHWVLKGDRTLDNELATDLTFCMDDPTTGKPMIFGTQLTTINCDKRQRKKDKMIFLREKQKTGEVDTITNSLSSRVHPDILLIITVNGKISEMIYSNRTPFRDAYTAWKDGGYKTGWPSRCLDPDIYGAIELVNHFLPQMTESFFLWQTHNFQSITSQKIVFREKEYSTRLNYKEEEDIFSVSLFENREWQEKFVFSADFTRSGLRK